MVSWIVALAVGHGPDVSPCFWAYLDPGSGSMLFQVLIAGLLECAVLRQVHLVRAQVRLVRRSGKGMTRHPLSAVSFRDPGGFVYEDEGCILRQVNFLARDDYDQLMRSGLYRELTERRLLIAHDEVDALPRVSATAYRVIRPEPVSLISYPFEWSFSQYKDAALLTLAVDAMHFAAG